MTTSVPKSISSKKYPDFIRNNILFKLYKSPEKIFPEIGLANCKEKVGEEFQTESLKLFKIYMLSQLRDLEKEVSNNNTHIHHFTQDVVKLVSKVGTSLEEANFLLDKKALGFQNPIDVFGVKCSNVLSIAHTLNDKFNYYYYGNSFEKAITKNHSKYIANLAPQLNMVFTSSGQNAYWDLATMSMRGLSSCQRWKNLDHRQKVIGSMLDPYVGILYLESGKKTSYGSEMVRRSLVRLVLNKDTGKKALLLERIYPNDRDFNYKDTITLGLFKDFLKRKTNDKFEIVYGQEGFNHNKWFIPYSEQTKDIISTFGDEYLSYRDSGVLYKDLSKKKKTKKSK